MVNNVKNYRLPTDFVEIGNAKSYGMRFEGVAIRHLRADELRAVIAHEAEQAPKRQQQAIAGALDKYKKMLREQKGITGFVLRWALNRVLTVPE